MWLRRVGRSLPEVHSRFRQDEGRPGIQHHDQSVRVGERALALAMKVTGLTEHGLRLGGGVPGHRYLVYRPEEDGFEHVLGEGTFDGEFLVLDKVFGSVIPGDLAKRIPSLARDAHSRPLEDFRMALPKVAR